MARSLARLLDPTARLMPQVLKEEVRARILEAARTEFATRGYVDATMASIAARADTGAAALYRYFPSKHALFEAVVPPSVVHELEALLTRRVRSLGAALGQGDETGEAMLAFWEANRLAVVILLDRSVGTPYASFGERFVNRLVKLTRAELARRGGSLDAPTRFVLRRIFENTRSMLASILEAHEDPRAMRAAVQSFWAYQIAGLHGLAQHTIR